MRSSHIDGAIYVAIAFCGSVAASLSSDDAAKYINANLLWWFKNSFVAAGAALLALKMYRSTQYAEDKQKQKVIEDTKQWKREKDEKIIPPTSGSQLMWWMCTH